MHGSIDCVKYLISKKCNVQLQTDCFCETPLHYAVQEGQIEIVQLLLDAGADPNAKNVEGETPMFTAVRFGRDALIPILKEKGGNINERNQEGATILEIALTMTSVKTAKALLLCGVDTNIPGIDKEKLEKIKNGEIVDEAEDDGENKAQENPLDNVDLGDQPKEDDGEKTLSDTSRDLISQLMEKKLSRRAEIPTAEVFQAVIENRFSELNDILNDFDVNTKIFDDETLLHTAVINHAVESIKILLEKGAIIDAKTSMVQETPLQLAVQQNMVDVIEILFDNNADIETLNYAQETPLFTAIRFGRKEAFNFMLDKGAKYDILNAEGATPLVVAIELHRKEMVIRLLDMDPDIKLGTIDPLIMAQNCGELDIIDLLTKTGQEEQNLSKIVSRASDSRPNSVLMKKPVENTLFEAIKTKNINLLKRLLSKPTELNINDPKHGIPLFRAIETGSLEIVKLLIMAGASINFKVEKTSIKHAIDFKNYNIIEYLIDEGADILELDKFNETALFYAVRSREPAVVELLINRGCSVNVVNSSNMSPLYIAVGIKHKEIVKILLKYQADPNNTGLPCLRLAKQTNDTELINILVNGGAQSEMKRTAHMNRVKSALQARCHPIQVRKLPPPPNKQCIICKATGDLVELIPCGHKLACKNCLHLFLEKFSTCPICKGSIFATKT